MEFFIAIDGAQQGPFPVGELVGRGMKADSLVWCEGMAQWQRADGVPELRPLVAPIPPVAPVAPDVPIAPTFPPLAGNPSQGYTPPLGYSGPVGYGGPPSQYGGGPYPPYVPGQSNRIPAGILALFLGCLGIHKFILGMTGPGLTMLLVTVLTCGWGLLIMVPISIVEGIIYLTKTDEQFHQAYVVEQRGWF